MSQHYPTPSTVTSEAQTHALETFNNQYPTANLWSRSAVTRNQNGRACESQTVQKMQKKPFSPVVLLLLGLLASSVQCQGGDDKLPCCGSSPYLLCCCVQGVPWMKTLVQNIGAKCCLYTLQLCLYPMQIMHHEDEEHLQSVGHRQPGGFWCSVCTSMMVPAQLQETQDSCSVATTASVRC